MSKQLLFWCGLEYQPHTVFTSVSCIASLSFMLKVVRCLCKEWDGAVYHVASHHTLGFPDYILVHFLLYPLKFILLYTQAFLYFIQAYYYLIIHVYYYACKCVAQVHA